MHSRKLEKIFDPDEHALPLGCKEFAQSPQCPVLKASPGFSSQPGCLSLILASI